MERDRSIRNVLWRMENGSITSNPNIHYSYPRLPSLSTARLFHFSKKATGTKISLKSTMTTDMK